MTVARIASRSVDAARESEPLRSIAERMRQRNVGSIVVQDQTGRPLGIVTDRDLVVRALACGLDPDRCTVSEIMTRNVATVLEDDAVEDALRIMRNRGLRRLVVVDGKGVTRGIVTLDDVLSLLAQEIADLNDVIQEQVDQG